MNWFVIAILGYTLLAVVFILDKFIVTKSVKPVVYAFYSTIFMFGALFALPFFGWGVLSGMDWFWAIVSGVAFGFGMWALFVAVKKGEATHINPFNGAMVTIFTYGLAYYFLQESLSNLQIVGLIVLILSSFLLSFEKSRKYSGFHMGFIWAMVAGLLFATSHVTAKYLYNIYPFWDAFIWTRATTGLVGLFLLFFSSVRKSFHGSNKEAKTYGKRHAVGLVVFDKVLSIGAIILLQYAMAIGTVTLVLALSGLQYVLMFVLVFLMTKFLPKVFKEYFTKQELIMQTFAIILVVIGSALFVL
jgi:uncharacterized membrane protein